MSALMRRIGFGCGRLAAGWESANSERLLEAALECGVDYFDTAPYYGGGDSERLLGAVLQRSGQMVQICTKVGLSRRARSGRANVRSMLVTGLRAALPSAVLDRLKRRGRRQQVAAASRSFGDFDPALMHESFQQSLQALRRERVDCLMLHEPAPSDPPQASAELLERFVAEGKVKRLGVGTFAALEDLPLYGAVAQFAIGRGTLVDPAGRSLIVHGLLRNVDFTKFFNALERTGISAIVPSWRQRSADPLFSSALLLNTIVLGTSVERVIVSTSSPKRLTTFLRMSESLYSELSADQEGGLEARLRKASATYLGLKHGASEVLS